MRSVFFFLMVSLLTIHSSNANENLSWKLFGHLVHGRQRFETVCLPSEKILIIGGYVVNNSVTKTCEIIDPNKRSIDTVSSMSVARTEFSTIVSGNSGVFAIGGFTGTTTTNTIEYYSFNENRWFKVGNLLVGRRQHSSVLINDSLILIVGGRDSNVVSLQSVEVFNLNSRKSQFVTSLPYPINNGTVQISSKGDILAFGGRDGGHDGTQTKDILLFDKSTFSWRTIDTLPDKCASPVVTRLENNSLLYTGGYNLSKKGVFNREVVYEKNNIFKKIATSHFGRNGHWSAQLDHNRIIIGGGNISSNETVGTTEIININNGQVEDGPTQLFSRSHSKATSLPKQSQFGNLIPRIIVISGANSKFLNSIEILDDSPTISGIINSYSSVTSVGKFPTSQIQVSDGKEFAVGDKVLIAQMQERPFSKTLSNKSLRYDFAGNHEFGRIVSINGNTIALEKQLTHHYSTLGKVQLVRVPEYGDVAVTGELTCKPWDGETGGILAFEANGTVSLQSHINVSGKGFNGAVPARETTSSLLYEDNTISTFSNTSSGEGISSSDTKMNSHTLVSNGGESGVVHNTGGAGGANTSCGGDGSLGWVSELSLNQAVASKGGKALEYNGKKVFMGGGGGAGHSDDGEIGTGGNGGGIVYISCDNLISNDYTINANGINGKECSLDGAGGGGAAGTIYLDIKNLHYPLVVNAIGGNGGNSVITNPDLPPAGSGGGGAGGVLLLKTHHNTIVAHLDGGQQGIAASVFSEHKAQSGCEGMLLDNVQIVDASSDKPDHKSFIDDCLTEDCSEYKTSKIQIPKVDNLQAAETDETTTDTYAKVGYVYPNPATDRVTIYGTELDVLSLYDNMGNRFSLPFIKNENSTTIDVSSLNNGIYFVKSRNTTLSFVITK